MTVALGQPGKVVQKAVVQSAYQHLPVLTSYRVEQTTRAVVLILIMRVGKWKQPPSKRVDGSSSQGVVFIDYKPIKSVLKAQYALYF